LYRKVPLQVFPPRTIFPLESRCSHQTAAVHLGPRRCLYIRTVQPNTTIRKPMRPFPLAAPLLLVPFVLLAEQPAHTPRTSPTPPVADHPTSLPVTRVALYKNGVGFFEHTGRVTGDAAVTIDFTSGQLNDVLQSLTAIDLNGGRISGAGYNSTTPLDQQL